jgi:hypothetical protein
MTRMELARYRARKYADLACLLVLPHPGKRARRHWPQLTPWPMASTDYTNPLERSA